MNHLSKRADQVIRLARQAAVRDEHGFVGSGHLLLGILAEDTSLPSRVLKANGVSEKKVRDELARLDVDQPSESGVLGMLPLTPHFANIMSRAVTEARTMGDWKVGTVHLLLALLGEQGCAGFRILKTLGISEDAFRGILEREMALG